MFGREILEAMAEDDAIRRRIYSRMDERDLTWWEESLRAVLDADFVRNDYFKRLCETVLSLARQARSVFVGRGADLILPANRGLRVRLVASSESRVRRYAAATGRDEEKARREVERIEKERAEFLHHRFRTDASDPLRHDLIVNLDRWETEDVVGMTHIAAGTRPPGASKTPGAPRTGWWRTRRTRARTRGRRSRGRRPPPWRCPRPRASGG